MDFNKSISNYSTCEPTFSQKQALECIWEKLLHRLLIIKTHGSESRGQEEAGLHDEAGLNDEPVSYLQVAPL